jgi:serine-type D-Ala-D-Ala carboxypeptidase (penicillin-binding protein 5/6)
MDKPAPPVTA